MAQDTRMPIDINPKQMLTLLDRQTVRFNLPPLSMAGAKEALRIHLDFDAESVGMMIERLQELHRQMKH